MKSLFPYRLLWLFLLLFPYLAPPALCQAPTTGSGNPNSSSTPPAALQRKGVMTAKELEKVDPVLAERSRYQSFLFDVYVTNLSEKSLRDQGYTELAEAARTELQRNAGLTDEEADKVKRIAADFMVDVDATNKMANELAAPYYHHRPPPSVMAPVGQHAINILNKAMARLIDNLGSKSFSRLDLYTRHYMEVRKEKSDRDTKAATASREAQR